MAVIMQNAQKRRDGLTLLIVTLATILLGCNKLNNPLGMMQGDSNKYRDEESNEVIDLNDLSPVTQRIAKKAIKRTQDYREQATNVRNKAKAVQQKVEKAQKKLEIQQQEYTEQVEQAAIAQHNLATNMLRLGAPIAEVAAATGLSSLDVRSRLLQEIRDAGRVRGKL